MRRAFKLAVLAALSSGLTAIVVACGDDDPAAPPPSGTDATAPPAPDDGSLAAPEASVDASTCAFGPGGQIGAAPTAWSHTCVGCVTTISAATGLVPDGGADAGTSCGEAVRFDSNATGLLTVRTPASGSLDLDVRSATTLRVYLRANNPNRGTSPAVPWQGATPVITLRSSAGTLRYEPTYHWLPYSWSEGWQQMDVALEGGRGFTRTLTADAAAPASVLADVDAIEIAASSVGPEPFAFDVAGMTFLTLPPPTCDRFSNDFSGTVRPPWQYGGRLPDAGAFVELTTYSAPPGAVRWSNPTYSFLFAQRNITRTTLGTFLPLPAGAAMLHPSGGGVRAALRWTAPASGTYEVRASFDEIRENGASPNTVDVHVYRGATSLFDGAINVGDAGTSARFVGDVTFAAGETIDVAVGNGTGSNAFDSTLVDVTVCKK